MASVNDIPAHLQNADSIGPLIHWLNSTPIPHLTRKELLHKWAAKFHVKLTAADYTLLHQ